VRTETEAMMREEMEQMMMTMKEKKVTKGFIIPHSFNSLSIFHAHKKVIVQYLYACSATFAEQ
jgi:hypothetical protein